MTELMQVNQLSRHYGRPPAGVIALDGVDLAVTAGEMVAITGPSGSGKSTLLTIMGGLASPTQGTVVLDGVDLWALDAAALATQRRRRIGFVFQHYNLVSGLTAAENVAAPLELDGQTRRAAARQAMDRLADVGLTDRAHAFPSDLSGGEQQRVAIARALVGERRLLLADEPTGAVDQVTGARVLDLLRHTCRDDVAVVVVTHDADVAARADRVIGLRDGRIDPSARR